MKRALTVILALVMALTLVIGSVSTVSAMPPLGPKDDGFVHFGVNYYWDGNGNRYLFDIIDFMNNSQDHTWIQVAQPLVYDYNHHNLDSNTTVTTDINWRTGVATFQGEKFSLTLTFNAANATVNKVDTVYGHIGNYYSGQASLSGTVTVNDGTTYTVPTTTVDARLIEEHNFPKPVR